MTIEAKLDKTNELLAQLLAKFDHIGRAQDEVAAENRGPVVDKAALHAKLAAREASYRSDDTAREAMQAKRDSAQVLTYEADVKPIALALAKADRAKLSAIWAKLGVKVGSELKPEQLADARRMILEASK